jgi:hypothetical protein
VASLVGDIMASLLKTTVRRIVGEQSMGMLDYWRWPETSGWGGAFNGQPLRRDLFAAVIKQLCPIAIIETGTFLGETTQFMAQTKIPVFTIEFSPRNLGFARAKLWRYRNVKFFRHDSRVGLRTLFDGPLARLTSRPLFFYLDAHWNADLPLAEELEIILDCCSSPVIMIDDFQVPDDPGYGYDNYGVGKALTPEYIAPTVKAHDLRVLYPATRSCDEGGQRRGCVVVTKDKLHGEKLSSLPLLRAGY